MDNKNTTNMREMQQTPTTEVTHSHAEVTENPKVLNREETLAMVTPYAFEVADDLVGTPLAKPLRRATALIIDLILVGILTTVNGLFLAGFAAFTFFRAGNRLKQKKRFNAARIVLRFLTALLLFAIVFVIVEDSQQLAKDTSSKVSINGDTDFEQGVKSVALIALEMKVEQEIEDLPKSIETGKCQDRSDCLITLAKTVAVGLAKLGLPEEKSVSYIQAVAKEEDFSLSANEAEIFTSELLSEYHSLLAQQHSENSENDSIVDAQTEELQTPEQETKTPERTEKPKPDGVDKVLNWLDARMDDLGLGFGWAMFYFSVFTAWWHGQTPGKKVTGIKVVKLDGKPLNLWESFNRYGGYAAGFTTGLMGFLQVYWDPNRQAIQDKISSTLVVRVGVPNMLTDEDDVTFPSETMPLDQTSAESDSQNTQVTTSPAPQPTHQQP